MEWIQVFTIIGILGGFNIYMLQRIEKDVDSALRRLDGHAQRIDQLYKIIIDLMKKRK